MVRCGFYHSGVGHERRVGGDKKTIAITIRNEKTVNHIYRTLTVLYSPCATSMMVCGNSI